MTSHKCAPVARRGSFIRYWIVIALSFFTLIALAAAAGSGSATAATPSKAPGSPTDPIVQEIMDQVTQADLMDIDAGLSGEHPIVVGGQPYTMTTRYTRQGPAIQKAWEYAYEQFAQAGLTPSYFDYTQGGYNLKDVIGEKTGILTPTQQILITAHIDDYSENAYNYAPGADDNGSGSAMLIEAARIIAQYPTDYTIRIVAFTGEEQGLWGSTAYANAAHQRGDQIVGVLNADMIAWDSNNDGHGDLYYDGYIPGSTALNQAIAETVSTYGLPLVLNQINDPYMAQSDHYPFWQNGYAAILGIEDDSGGDFNAYYHSTNDRQNCGGNNPCGFNPPYYTAWGKAFIGTMAHLAGVHARPNTTPTPALTPTRTPTYEPTTTCCNPSGNVTATCTALDTYAYDVALINPYPNCGLSLYGPVTIYFQVASDPNGTWTNYDQYFAGNISLPPMQWVHIQGSFYEPSIPPPNAYYRIRWHMEYTNCQGGQYQEGYSDPAALCPGPPATATSTPTATGTSEANPTSPPTETPERETVTAMPATYTPLPPTATPCSLQFRDVLEGSTFYPYVRCLACRGVVGGYLRGFYPNNNITRGQIAKVVSNAARYEDSIPSDRQSYTDVPYANTFWVWVERLTERGIIGGYSCGGPGEPCDAQQRAYYRWANNATRGQLVKIVGSSYPMPIVAASQIFEDVSPANPIYPYVQWLGVHGIVGGYACGGPGEQCVPPNNRPYFRPNSNVTRGQASKIVAGVFFPNCDTP